MNNPVTSDIATVDKVWFGWLATVNKQFALNTTHFSSYQDLGDFALLSGIFVNWLGTHGITVQEDFNTGVKRLHAKNGRDMTAFLLKEPWNSKIGDRL